MSGRERKSKPVLIEHKIRNWVFSIGLCALALIALSTRIQSLESEKKAIEQKESALQVTIDSLESEQAREFRNDLEKSLRQTATAMIERPNEHEKLLRTIPANIADSVVMLVSSNPKNEHDGCSANLVSLDQDNQVTTGAFTTIEHCLRTYRKYLDKGRYYIFTSPIQITEVSNVSPDSYTGTDPAVMVEFTAKTSQLPILKPLNITDIGCQPTPINNKYLGISALGLNSPSESIIVFGNPRLVSTTSNGQYFDNLVASKGASGGGVFNAENCLSSVMGAVNFGKEQFIMSPVNHEKVIRALTK